jgi:hypothetical protein
MSSSSSSSSSPSSKDDSAEEKQKLQKKKMDGRQKRVLMGYRLSMMLYGMMSIAMLLGPISTTSKGHGSLSMLLPLAGNYATGPIMAATFCYILLQATQANRLSSETYKRANLYLSQYGAIYLAAAALVQWGSSCMGTPLSGGTQKLLSPILLFVSFVSLVNGLKGWSYGVWGWDKQQKLTTKSLFQDFCDVFFFSWIRILSVIPQSLASLGFGMATIFVKSLEIMTLLDIFRLVIPEILVTLATSGGTTRSSSSITSVGIMASKMMQLTRLLLLSCICLTLKDAADRNRLTGTTFIQYNALSTLTFGCMAAHSLAAGKATTLSPLVAAAACALFSAFSAVIGLVSIRVKNQQSNKSKSK